tara:strand:+ start:5624 stop:5830 length:207 start_codon:yes stop_codon:yes gene_type:complete
LFIGKEERREREGERERERRKKERERKTNLHSPPVVCPVRRVPTLLQRVLHEEWCIAALRLLQVKVLR